MTELLTAHADPIDEYLTRLGNRLRGAKAAKADLLNEARGGLVDAADGYREAGYPPAEAARLAVRDFGPVDEVAPAYQGELGLAGGIGALRAIMIAIPAMHVVFELTRMLWIGEWSSLGGPPAPAWYHQVAVINDHSGYVIAVLAFAGLLATRPLLRRVGSMRAGRMLTTLATAGLAVAVLVQVSVMVGTALVNPSWLALSLPTTLVGIGSLLVMVRLFVLAHRSVLFCREPVAPH